MRLLRARASIAEKFEFIDSEKEEYAVHKMCGWLEVSRSGYYDWRDRVESATVKRREELLVLVKEIFAHNHGTYGYRRVHAVLARSGVECSADLVRQLMRQQGLVAVQPRPWRWNLTEQSGHDHRIPDLVNRDFSADVPGTKLIGDITYIPTEEGWWYLATVIDCATKKVIGYAMDSHYKTPLIATAIDNAVTGADVASGAIFHSDRGSNYTSYDFAKKLKSLGIRQSVGRTGVCWDNAMAESFFGALKNEWLHHKEFATRAEARSAVVYYIEGFYNNRRLHSSLEYRTPQETENDHYRLQIAA